MEVQRGFLTYYCDLQLHSKQRGSKPSVQWLHLYLPSSIITTTISPLKTDKQMSQSHNHWLTDTLRIIVFAFVLINDKEGKNEKQGKK